MFTNNWVAYNHTYIFMYLFRMRLMEIFGNSAQDSKDRFVAENILCYIQVKFQGNV